MSVIEKALKVLISSEKFCCVCLQALDEEAVSINDEMFIPNSEDNYVDMVEIMFQVVRAEINFSISDEVCKSCTSILLSSYRLIQMCKENQTTLKNTAESLQNSIELYSETPEYYKTLFLSIDSCNYTSMQYYDEEKSQLSLDSVRNRYKTIKTEHFIKEEIDNDEVLDVIFEPIENESFSKRKKKQKLKEYSPIIYKKKQYLSIPIPTKDMMSDSNNLEQPKCKECFKQFKDIHILRQHFIRVHAPKVFKCADCPRSYGSSGLLEAHRTESHIEVVCSLCGRTFYNRSTLKQHELSHKRSIICQDCGRIYKNRNTFKHHKETGICSQKTRKTQNTAQYECDICNKRYSQKGSLRVHMRFEHGSSEYLICSWCSKKFVAPSKLKTHILKHTQEKNFPCTICNGKFVSKESLVYHTRIHTGETPFSCEYCDQKFLSISRRTEHVKRNHLQVEQECDICHIKLKSGSCLQRHRKRHFNSKNALHVQSEEDQNKI